MNNLPLRSSQTSQKSMFHMQMITNLSVRRYQRNSKVSEKAWGWTSRAPAIEKVRLESYEYLRNCRLYWFPLHCQQIFVEHWKVDSSRLEAVISFALPIAHHEKVKKFRKFCTTGMKSKEYVFLIIPDQHYSFLGFSFQEWKFKVMNNSLLIICSISSLHRCHTNDLPQSHGLIEIFVTSPGAYQYGFKPEFRSANKEISKDRANDILSKWKVLISTCARISWTSQKRFALCTKKEEVQICTLTYWTCFLLVIRW